MVLFTIPGMGTYDYLSLIRVGDTTASLLERGKPGRLRETDPPDLCGTVSTGARLHAARARRTHPTDDCPDQ